MAACRRATQNVEMSVSLLFESEFLLNYFFSLLDILVSLHGVRFNIKLHVLASAVLALIP